WQAHGLSAVRAISAPPFAIGSAVGSPTFTSLPSKRQKPEGQDFACPLGATVDRSAGRRSRPLRDGDWIRERSETVNMGSPFGHETQSVVCCGYEAMLGVMSIFTFGRTKPSTHNNSPIATQWRSS